MQCTTFIFFSFFLEEEEGLNAVVSKLRVYHTHPLSPPHTPILPSFYYAESLLTCIENDNVPLQGKGTIDGQGLVKDATLGTSWQDRKAASTLDYGRPRIYEPMFSSNLYLQDVSITNQAFWAV